MKFGKRRKDADAPADDSATVAPPETPTHTATESWTVPGAGAAESYAPPPPHTQTYEQAPYADTSAYQPAPAYEPAPAAPPHDPGPPAYAPAPAAPPHDPGPPAPPAYEPESAPASEYPPYAPPEAVVEGEAVEIPAAEPAAAAPQPAAAAYETPVAYTPPPEPVAAPFAVAGQPVVVAASGAEPAQAVPLGTAAETFASGHGPVSGPAWPEGVQALAADRPEVLVGAAFVGGLLAAMIIRRLGN